MNIVEPIRSKIDLERIETALEKQNLRDLLFFVMGTNSGLRISDILSLNVEDVRDKTHITIREKKTKKYKKFPINEKLKILIKRHTENRKKSEPLFKTIYDNRLDRHQAYRIINSVCNELGIDYKVGTHSLRKTFGYHHYIKFKDIAILQKILNHSSTSITLRYIGIEQDRIDESYMNFIL